jgi:DNA-binding response OmpR family regulator
MTGADARRLLWKKLEGVHFTLTERAILDLLADGVARPVDDVVKVLGDPYAERATLRVHISNMRKKIGHLRHEIVCEYRNQRTMYRYVLLVSSLAG